MGTKTYKQLAVGLVGLATLAGCGSGGAGTQATKATTTQVSSYQGSGSVGDFFKINVDHAAQTIAYTNLTNGTSGSVGYTVNADGSYSTTDPGIVEAIEVKDTSMVVSCNNSGPNHNTPCLVTAVESKPFQVADLANQTYNYMQWRTANGGLEIGYVAFDAAGNGAHKMFSPIFAQQSQNPIMTQNFTSSVFSDDPTHEFITMNFGPGDGGTLFGTPSGYAVFDTQNGTGVCMRQPASKAFDPANAGTYHAILYQKHNAQEAPGNTETGTPEIGRIDISVDGSGNVTASNPNQGNQVVYTGTLAPVADQAYLVGPGNFDYPCNGMFTCRTTVPGVKQSDLFVTFLQGSLYYSYYETALPFVNPQPPPQANGHYDYAYGVGLKQ